MCARRLRCRVHKLSFDILDTLKAVSVCRDSTRGMHDLYAPACLETYFTPAIPETGGDILFLIPCTFSFRLRVAVEMMVTTELIRDVRQTTPSPNLCFPPQFRDNTFLSRHHSSISLQIVDASDQCDLGMFFATLKLRHYSQLPCCYFS